MAIFIISMRFIASGPNFTNDDSIGLGLRELSTKSLIETGDPLGSSFRVSN